MAHIQVWNHAGDPVTISGIPGLPGAVLVAGSTTCIQISLRVPVTLDEIQDWITKNYPNLDIRSFTNPKPLSPEQLKIERLRLLSIQTMILAEW